MSPGQLLFSCCVPHFLRVARDMMASRCLFGIYGTLLILCHNHSSGCSDGRDLGSSQEHSQSAIPGMSQVTSSHQPAPEPQPHPRSPHLHSAWPSRKRGSVPTFSDTWTPKKELVWDSVWLPSPGALQPPGRPSSAGDHFLSLPSSPSTLG